VRELQSLCLDVELIMLRDEKKKVVSVAAD
jgi:hypothetical protein